MKKLIVFLALSLICTFTFADSAIIISQEQAWEIVRQNVIGNKCKDINVYTCTSVMPANSLIKT